MRKYGKLWIQISLKVKNKLIQFVFCYTIFKAHHSTKKERNENANT